MLVTSFIIGTVLTLTVNAQFPTECIANLTSTKNPECCVIPEGFTEQCGGLERGSCEKLNTTFEPLSNWILARDDRWMWPSHFFSKGCVCNPPYGGFACQDCMLGRTGPNCTDEHIVVRRDILSLNETERTTFFNVLALSKTTPFADYSVIENAPEKKENLTAGVVSVYDYFVYLNYFASRATDIQKVNTSKDCMIQRLLMFDTGSSMFNNMDGKDGGPAFGPWHRYLLLWFERELQKIANDANFSLPYWNWATGGTECDVCTDDLFGGENSTAPTTGGFFLNDTSAFSKWPIMCPDYATEVEQCQRCDPMKEAGRLFRNAGKNASFPALPTMAHVQLALQQPAYDVFPFNEDAPATSFRNLLEGLVGGPAAPATTAAPPATTTWPGLIPWLKNKIKKPMAPEAVRQYGMQALVKKFLGGAIDGPTPTQASDPIFFAMHAFTDLIYEAWLRQHSSTAATSLPPAASMLAPLGQKPSSNLVGFYPPITMAEVHTVSTNLGYDYEFPEDLLAAPVDGPALQVQLSLFQQQQLQAAADFESMNYHGLSTGAAAAIGIVALVLATAVVVGGVYVVKKRRANATERQPLIGYSRYG